MKKPLLGTIALAMLMTGSATAADLARPIPVYIPPVTVFTWTGFYIGANIGGHWGKDDISTATSAPNFGVAGAAVFDALSPISLKPKGVIGGLQGAFNWQISGVVLGIEADANWLDGSSSRTLLFPGPAPAAGDTFTNSTHVTFLTTVCPRLGIAIDRTLPYITGGVAFGTIKTTDTASVFAGTLIETASNTTTRSGWALGGGLEYAFTNAWSAKAEYLYVNLGRFDTTIACVSTVVVACISAADVVVHHKYSDNIVRAGLNYRFSGL